MTYLRALPLLLGSEGGEVNDPADRGGHTNHGVTQETYDGWREMNGQGPRSVSRITNGEVEAIYERLYWKAGRCDTLPWPLSYLHFDACVNHGVRSAAEMLQQVLGVEVDGIIGPKTRAAADVLPPALQRLCEDYLWARLQLYSDIVKYSPSQIRFLRGWLNRMIRIREEIR